MRLTYIQRLRTLAQKVSESFIAHPQSALITGFIFALVSFVANGYVIFGGDLLVYMPYVMHLNNPLLFNSDMLISFNQGNWTVYSLFLRELNYYLSEHLFYVVVFLASLSVRTLFFYSIIRITRFLFNGNTLALLAPVTLISGLLVYGTATGTFDSELIPRAVAIPINLLALAFYMEKRKVLATILITLTIPIHLLSFFMFFGVFCLETLITVIKDHRITAENVFVLLLPFVSTVGFVLSTYAPLDQSVLIDDEWRSILFERDQFAFVTAWWGYATTLLFHMVLDIAAYLFLRTRIFTKGTKQQLYFDVVFAVPFILFVLSFVLVDIIGIQPIAQLQLPRAFLLWKLFVPLGFVAYLYKMDRSDIFKLLLVVGIIASFVFKETVLFVFLPAFFFYEYASAYKVPFARYLAALGVIVSVAGLIALSVLRIKTQPYLVESIVGVSIVVSLWYAITRIYKAISIRILVVPLLALCTLIVFVGVISNRHFYLPKWYKDPDFMSACEWVRQNTKPDDILLTEPYSNVPELRILCERSIYTTEKDGSPSLFSRSYAVEWYRRTLLLTKIYNDPTVVHSLYSEGVRYIFAEQRFDVPYEEVYENGSYHIYAVTEGISTYR